MNTLPIIKKEFSLKPFVVLRDSKQNASRSILSLNKINISSSGKIKIRRQEYLGNFGKDK